MKYGLENLTIQEPLSLILSIILVLGVSQLGLFFQNYLKRKYELKFFTNYFFSPIIGTYLLIFILNPLCLYGLVSFLTFLDF